MSRLAETFARLSGGRARRPEESVKTSRGFRLQPEVPPEFRGYRGALPPEGGSHAESFTGSEREWTGGGGLVTYVTAGDPDAATSAEILIALARAGADVLEVGVPFSDPLADGPAIQRAIERALRSGTTLRRTLELIGQVRSSIDAPIVLFTYANPVLRMDAARFAADAREAGVDGVLILDFPVEESATLREPLVRAGIDPIFLISPTTTDERIRQSSALGGGFLYVISRLGVTGARDDMADDTAALIARVRRNASLPIAVGFGISRPEHVAAACRHADAAVVGSALVSVIAAHGRNGVTDAVAEYVRWLKSAL